MSNNRARQRRIEIMRLKSKVREMESSRVDMTKVLDDYFNRFKFSLEKLENVGDDIFDTESVLFVKEIKTFHTKLLLFQDQLQTSMSEHEDVDELLQGNHVLPSFSENNFSANHSNCVQSVISQSQAIQRTSPERLLDDIYQNSFPSRISNSSVKTARDKTPSALSENSSTYYSLQSLPPGQHTNTYFIPPPNIANNIFSCTDAHFQGIPPPKPSTVPQTLSNFVTCAKKTSNSIHSNSSGPLSIHNGSSQSIYSVESSSYESPIELLTSKAFQSSNFKTDTVPKRAFTNECENPDEERPVIYDKYIIVPSSMTATLSNVIDPSNFWIQLSRVEFPSAFIENLVHPSCVEKGEFYFAPGKSGDHYCRIQVLCAESENSAVEVFYIDCGYTQQVNVSDLVQLPPSACETPSQALNCYLHMVHPTNSTWCSRAIELFKANLNKNVVVEVKSQFDNKYGVRLLDSSTNINDEDEPVNLGLHLILEGVATSAETDIADSLNANFDKIPKTVPSCSLELQIPEGRIPFTYKEFKVLVCSVVNLDEFYVNIVSPQTGEMLMELEDGLSVAYKDESLYSVLTHDLREGMFCAGLSPEQAWCRVQLLEQEHEGEWQVYYVDHGEVDVLHFSKLRPLFPSLANYPSFAIKCSLALVESKTISASNEETSDTLELFLKFVDDQQLVTAKLYEERSDLDNDPHSIFLWVVPDSEDCDILINKAIADSGEVVFDVNQFQIWEEKQLSKPMEEERERLKELEILDSTNYLEEEYNSVLNSYGVDVDDLEVITTGYKQRDSDRLCNYYALRGFCPKGRNCEKQHIPFDSSGATRDQDEQIWFSNSIELPEPSTHVLLEIVSICSPGKFYVIFPYGPSIVKYPDEDWISYNGEEIWLFQELMRHMKKHYSAEAFKENTGLGLALGTIVAAKCSSGTWLRAQIIGQTDIGGKYKVFYIDFGTQEWINRKDIRQLNLEYCHLPPQAVLCSLADVEPVGKENNQDWSNEAKTYFIQLVEKQLMCGFVQKRVPFNIEDVKNADALSLRLTNALTKADINKELVIKGFAQVTKCSEDITLNKIKYLPA